MQLYLFLKPYTDYSAFENRILEHIQLPTVDGLLSGAWFEQFEAANMDQIVGRNQFIEANARILQIFGKREVNNIIIIGKYDCLLQKNNEVTKSDWEELERIEAGDFSSETALSDRLLKQQDQLSRIQSLTDAYGGQFYYLNFYPRESFLWNRYPYPNEDIVIYNDRLNAAVLRELENMGVNTVDTFNTFKIHNDEYLYFYTDHHYTQKGAYYSYLDLLDAINNSDKHEKLNIPKWDDMQYTCVDKTFIGSLIQQIGDTQYERADFLEYALPKDYPADFDRFESGSLSDMPVIRDEDTTEYGWFMNGDNGNTVIKTHRPELPSILIIGYSFTDALETLAIYNFDEMHSIDPRSFDGDVYEYIADSKCDYVVIQGECDF